jgi:calcineurin-like phosphoesterase family protein
MTIWFTSDTHFGHRNICGPTLSIWKEGYRHFKSLQDMEDEIVEKCNSLVGENDILYHLGDFIMGPNVDTELPRIRSRIKCKTIHHIPGNHHKFDKWPELKKQFTSFEHYYELKYKGKLIVCFHYPIASWNEMHHGSIHAFGHTHQSYKGKGRCIDVGVEGWDYYPISIDRLIDECNKKEFVAVDHHQPEGDL